MKLNDENTWYSSCFAAKQRCYPLSKPVIQFKYPLFQFI